MKKYLIDILLIVSLSFNLFVVLFYGRTIYSIIKKTFYAKDIYERKSAKNLIHLKFFDAQTFKVTGRYHKENNYHRLPAKFENIVRPEVWNLSKNTAGIAVHFTTNSPSLAVKWKLTDYSTYGNMTSICSSGLDLYCFVNGNWQYVKSALPSALKSENLLISDMDSTIFRDYFINLPLYNGVENIEIGINEKFTITTETKNHFTLNKPIVFYGTSITQGGSASRPGMAYTSIISRRLNTEVVNLGFNGNGLFEESVGQALCEIDASLFVIDCTPNSDPDIVKENALSLVKQIRKCRPKAPILLLESIMREYSYFKLSDENTYASFKYIQAQNRELKQSYLKAIESGIKDLYYLESDGLIGYDHEGTVDGTHLSDLGQSRIADKVEAKLTDILKLK